jgi:hypothetical protein
MNNIENDISPYKVIGNIVPIVPGGLILGHNPLGANHLGWNNDCSTLLHPPSSSRILVFVAQTTTKISSQERTTNSTDGVAWQAQSPITRNETVRFLYL